MKDHIIYEKEQYEAIGLRGFEDKLFEEEGGGGVDRDQMGILIWSI